MSYLNKNAKRWAAGSPGLRLGVALLITIAAFAIRKTIHPYVQPHVPFHFVVAAAIVTEFFAGLVPAIVSLIIGMALGFYYFLKPYNSFSVPTEHDFIIMIINVIIAMMAILLLEYLRRSQYSTKLTVGVVNSQRRSLLEVYNQMLFQQRKSQVFARELTSTFAAMDHMLLLTAPGQIPYRMPAWYRMTGEQNADDRESEWDGMIHPDDRDMLRHELQSAENPAAAASKPLRFRLKTRDDEYRWINGAMRTIHYRRQWRMTVVCVNEAEA
jgi:K+-sensing histidine kinase KdpD